MNKEQIKELIDKIEGIIYKIKQGRYGYTHEIGLALKPILAILNKHLEDQEDYAAGLAALERNEPTITLEELENNLNNQDDFFKQTKKYLKKSEDNLINSILDEYLEKGEKDVT